MKTDCKNKVRWNVAFNTTKTELQRDYLRSEKPKHLSVKIVMSQYVSTYQDSLALTPHNSTTPESGRRDGLELDTQLFKTFEYRESSQVLPDHEESKNITDGTLEIHSDNTYKLSHEATTLHYMDVQSSHPLATNLIFEPPLGSRSGMSK